MALNNIKNHHKVSIGIPVYNGADSLTDTLESLLSQSYHSFEIIISDNCSTDSTPEICQKYALLDQRIRWISQSENIGPVANFCYLLDQASCPFFMWAAADDLWSPGYLQETISKLQSSPNAAFAVTPYKCCSRAFPLFSRRSSSCLRVININSDLERLKAFASLPLSLHKDNLVYALYRTGFLKECIQDVSVQVLGHRFIGGPVNDIIVFRGQGVFVPKARFYKRYKYFPPHGAFDHACMRMKSLVGLLRQMFLARSFSFSYRRNTAGSEIRNYASNLKKVYDYACLSETESSALIQACLAGSRIS